MRDAGVFDDIASHQAIGADLHQRDLDLLTMEWQGLSTKEISQRTGMTAASVDSRFQRINSRLKCQIRKASAKRAAAQGLLKPG
ncbi:sigma-70-like protein [Roseateles toxinivorans]|uniref:Sigma-70-like protein n=2 Tax=Roseateles toxinivorans TaxID=270368 RepID=A0A4R6QJY2_9BURK|nr:sigma-70-like protein [Roseateles toxinivorans]